MKHQITVLIDESCEAAEVLLDGKTVMRGNFWDFHPYCTGVHQYGEFQGYRGLANAVEVTLLRQGHEVEVVTDKNWKCE